MTQGLANDELYVTVKLDGVVLPEITCTEEELAEYARKKRLREMKHPHRRGSEFIRRLRRRWHAKPPWRRLLLPHQSSLCRWYARMQFATVSVWRPA